VSETLYSKRIRALAHSSVAQDRIIAAGHACATGDLMIRLAKDPETIVREALAANPSTCSEALEMLAGDSHWAIRHLVASAPAVPAGVLRKLIKDPQLEVALAAVVNPNFPEDEAMRIARGPRSLLSLQMTLAKHSASPAVLTELAGHKNLKVLILTARNQATPAEGLLKMISASSKTLHRDIIQHPNVTLEILGYFVDDGRKDIRDLLPKRMIKVEKKCRESACADYAAELDVGDIGYGGGL